MSGFFPTTAASVRPTAGPRATWHRSCMETTEIGPAPPAAAPRAGVRTAPTHDGASLGPGTSLIL